MKFFLSFCLLITLALNGFGQTVIKGKLLDKKGKPVVYANVLIKDMYDGTSSGEDGSFEFETEEEGEQILLVKAVGYKTLERPIVCNGGTIEVELVVEASDDDLDPVVISAGSFEASDEKKSVVLRPLDIVTTAGAGGDLFQAIKTLPGAQQVGEQEGLFVRGGSAAETKTVIDEMIVQNPFFSSVPDVPQRGRFSPFLFKGTVFSTGGYSAVYGQALSSALILNSVDMFETNSTSIGIMPLGGNISHTFHKKNTAVSFSGGYTHLGLYFKLINQERDWVNPPEGVNGTLTVRQRVGDKGIFKFYGTYSQNDLALNYQNIDDTTQQDWFRLNNQNVYLNTSYKHYIGDNWSLFTGLSYAIDLDEIDQTQFQLESTDQLSQVKVVASRDLGKYSQLKFGGEVHSQTVEAVYDTFPGLLEELYYASFMEGDIFLTNRLATRIGMRQEYSQLLDAMNIAPRASLAYKTGENSQVSLAYGHFYQTPENQFLLSSQGIGNSLGFENATHYIANYQYMNDDRTFRIEFYAKDYNDLVLYDVDNTTGLWSNMSNDGFGWAQGFDIFFRDKKTFKNTDYWISYSFLDTERRYREFPISAPPSFTSKHTMSVVFKHWIQKITTSFGFTFAYGSGRPYYNPNLGRGEFHSERTGSYQNLAINASHLTTILGGFTVIFASIDNVFNRDNTFAYRYSADGTSRQRVGPPALRTFFLGLFTSFDWDAMKAERKKLEEAKKKEADKAPTTD